MNVVFMGTSDFAVPHLIALSRAPGVKLLAVVSQPDRPSGRGRRLESPPVKKQAELLGLPQLQPERINTRAFREAISLLHPDVLVVVSFGQILRPKLLGIPRLGCLNVHASILPRHRGASPIQAQILAGDAEVGVSIMALDEGLDTGPVAKVAKTAARPRETAIELEERLAGLGAPLLVEALAELAAGRLHFQPQNPALVSTCGIIRKTDGDLDFRRPAQELERQIRAYQPWPGCTADLQTRSGVQRIQIVKAEASDTQSQSPIPGETTAVHKDNIQIATGAGQLILRELKPAGKRSMSVREYLNGAEIFAGDLWTSPRRESPGTLNPEGSSL